MKKEVKSGAKKERDGMKAASVAEIKAELKAIAPATLVEICLRLARYKKENKELLTYLLFEADDVETYIQNVKQTMDEEMETLNATNLYFAKKTIRKVLRITNKFIRYTGSKQAEAELLIYFCSQLKKTKLPIHKSTALTNLYKAQIKKIQAAVDSLHEDLQYDYLRQMENLSL
jgi:hypothetical protein